MYTAMMFAQELQRGGDDVVILSDRGDSVADSRLAQRVTPFHDLVGHPSVGAWRVPALRALVGGRAWTLEGARIELLAGNRDHASLRGLLLEGRQLVTS
jgi:hypothetical protein